MKDPPVPKYVILITLWNKIVVPSYVGSPLHCCRTLRVDNTYFITTVFLIILLFPIGRFTSRTEKIGRTLEFVQCFINLQGLKKTKGGKIVG